MSNTLVSVILPVYNAGPALAEAFERLDDALPDNAQVVVVDDGSTDATGEIAQTYAQSRPWVTLISRAENQGVAAARNAALEKVVGKYVWFVDWDDQWDSDILRIMLRRAEEDHADVVVCRSTWRLDSGLDIGETESINRALSPGENAFDWILEGKLKGYLWSKLFRRELLPPDMFPRQRSQSDFCGMVPVMSRVESVSYEPTTLYHHVIRDGSITNSREPELANLTKCRDVVRAVASTLPHTPAREAALLHYDYAYWYLSRVNTAVRLSSRTTAAREIKSVSTAMSFKEIVAVGRLSLNVAVKSALVKLLRGRYAGGRRSFTAVRRRVRGLRSRVA